MLLSPILFNVILETVQLKHSLHVTSIGREKTKIWFLSMTSLST